MTSPTITAKNSYTTSRDLTRWEAGDTAAACLVGWAVGCERIGLVWISAFICR